MVLWRMEMGWHITAGYVVLQAIRARRMVRGLGSSLRCIKFLSLVVYRGNLRDVGTNTTISCYTGYLIKWHSPEDLSISPLLRFLCCSNSARYLNSTTISPSIIIPMDMC